MADYLALELARGQGSHADVAVVVQGRLGLHARACRWAALSRADLARAGRDRGTHTIGGDFVKYPDGAFENEFMDNPPLENVKLSGTSSWCCNQCLSVVILGQQCNQE